MALVDSLYVEDEDISGAELRALWSSLAPGVWATGDLAVTSGVGLSLDVAAGSALVPGRSGVVDQGNYRVRNDAVVNSGAFETGGVPANGTANPRVDQVIIRQFDDVYDNSGRRDPRLEIVPGVATAGATLDNRTGAVADAAITAMAGSGWLRLYDYLVGAGAASINPLNIRDRRALVRGQRLVSDSNTGFGLSTTEQAFGGITFESNGRPALVGVNVQVQHANNTTTAGALARLELDGVAIARPRDNNEFVYDARAFAYGGWSGQAVVTPAAGQHTLRVMLSAGVAGVWTTARVHTFVTEL